VCSHRANVDVSAVGSDQSPLAYYHGASGGWDVLAGTSAATPFVAGVMALTGHTADGGPSFPYKHASDFFDVTSGSNGTCNPALLCNAGPGWDGASGVGSPNGAALKK
jgi:hypothetical protein